jgi:hypothetical protein
VKADRRLPEDDPDEERAVGFRPRRSGDVRVFRAMPAGTLARFDDRSSSTVGAPIRLRIRAAVPVGGADREALTPTC